MWAGKAAGCIKMHHAERRSEGPQRLARLARGYCISCIKTGGEVRRRGGGATARAGSRAAFRPAARPAAPSVVDAQRAAPGRRARCSRHVHAVTPPPTRPSLPVGSGDRSVASPSMPATASTRVNVIGDRGALPFVERMLDADFHRVGRQFAYQAVAMASDPAIYHPLDRHHVEHLLWPPELGPVDPDKLVVDAGHAGDHPRPRKGAAVRRQRGFVAVRVVLPVDEGMIAAGYGRESTRGRSQRRRRLRGVTRAS